MIRKLCNGLLLVMLLGLCTLTQAGMVKGLYSAEMLVPEQLAQPSDEQLQQGLKAVLIKVSGRSNVMNKPAVVSALQQPSAWLNQFSYQATQTPISAGDGREVLGQRLLLEFDQVLVERLLQQANLNPVGSARPVVLVWLAEQRGAAPRDYVAPESEIYTQLTQQAQARGVPLDIPLFDLNDQTALDVSDLWGFFREPIEQASQRYQPDAILIGRLTQSHTGGWQTEWLLLQAGNARSIKPEGALSDQLQEVIDDTADTVLASLGAVHFNYVETGLQLEVTNVADTEDYLQLLDYLRQLPPVEALRISGVQADRVQFRVEVQGGVSSLEQAIRLNPRMSPTPRLNAGGAETVYSYRWQD
ncbi:DUF2066 domain-containing protein [Amphritea sp.]|uniref:DUF2066 domain-containing protein n=1 Tax=Amphritea sp. TaxID=1872502 RepID=UPI003A8DD852